MQEYTMEEMKRVIGHNIVALRRGAGLTQSELAEKLNYSDKAVSKWECGDAVPDILILTRITAIFGVTLDWLVKSEHEVDMPAQARFSSRSRTIVTLLSAALVWLIATAVFVLLGGLRQDTHGVWLSFIIAIPVSSLVAFVLCAVWKRRVAKYLFISIFLWGILLVVYLFLIVYQVEAFHTPWMLFFLGIPGEAIIVLWSHLFPRRRARIKENENKETEEN